MKDRGHNRDPKQCRVKLKELRQAYQKTREANSRSGSEPQTCRFYDELHAILGGSATTTPAVLFDSFNGDGGNTEAGFGDEEDDDDEEVVDSSQQASGETGFPDSQELFLTLDLEPVPPEPTQGCLLDPAGGEGTSAACVSMITGSSPSQRLVKLRKKKKRTRDEMFSELMLSSHTDRAQTNAWRQIMSECRKAQNDREERWRAEESKWRAEESKWRAEDRAEAQMWRQRDERRQDSMLRLLQDQTSMLQCMAELQQRQLEHRLPLQPLCNQPPSSPSSIASTPRRPRTRWGGLRPTSHSTTEDCMAPGKTPPKTPALHGLGKKSWISSTCEEKPSCGIVPGTKQYSDITKGMQKLRYDGQVPMLGKGESAMVAVLTKGKGEQQKSGAAPKSCCYSELDALQRGDPTSSESGH
nr:uncharacterized protein LOC125636032 [Caretta caretta]